MQKYSSPKRLIMFSDLTPTFQDTVLRITGISSPEEVGWHLGPIFYSKIGFASNYECEQAILLMLGASP